MRNRVQARFSAEHDHLAGVLREADQSGLSAHDAVQRALAAIHDNRDDWETLLGAVLQDVARTSGQRLVTQIRKKMPGVPDYDDSDPDGELASILDDYVPTLAQSITDTTHDQLGNLLSDVLAAAVGLGISDLLDSLQQQYDTWSGDDGRASVIADSTTVQGWEAGAYDAAQQATDGTGAEVTRTWTTVGDAKVRPEHAAADGQTVGLHEPFDVGGESLLYPASPEGSPGNTINCRCTIAYDVSGGSAAEQDAALSEAEDSGEMSRRLNRLARKHRRDTFRAFREVTLP